MATPRKAKRVAPKAVVKKSPAARPARKPSAKPAAKPAKAKTQAHGTAFDPSDTWLNEMHEALLRRREQLASVVRSNQGQLAEARKNHADIGDRAAEGFEDELAAGLLSIESAQLDQIEEALSRMDKGTYGVCIECEKPIPRRRLEILPFAKRCLACEGEKERQRRSYRPGEEEEEEESEGE